MPHTSTLSEFLSAGALVSEHKPYGRFLLNREQWLDLVEALAENDWDLVSVWAEPAQVHVALYEESSRYIAVASLECTNGRYPTLSNVRPSAIRLERMIQESTGLVAENLIDTRNWLDHGQFPVLHPLKGNSLASVQRRATDYQFLPVLGEGLHQIPVGPVHAGIIEPGHFRFTCNGEAVVRLEERLGYVHKGIELLMQGKSPADASKVAARVSGDSTVAHSLAFARAVEAALSVTVPILAHWIRGIMAELERVANHLGDMGAICNDAAFPFMLAQTGVLRERVLATSSLCFGHRLMMDCIIPGGVVCDLQLECVQKIKELVSYLRHAFPPLVELYHNTLSLQDRTMGTGLVSKDLVDSFAAGGFVGRGSGRSYDARRVIQYPPYESLDFKVPTFIEGDVNARVWVRIREVEASMSIIETLLTQRVPGGATRAEVPLASGEGMAIVEGFRGDIMTWVRLDTNGLVARCHPRDPSWFQWPLLEACIENNIVADFPLCNKSFNCSYSGHDL